MLERFENIPDMLELDHLTVSGDVTFGKNVTLKVDFNTPHHCLIMLYIATLFQMFCVWYCCLAYAFVIFCAVLHS